MADFTAEHDNAVETRPVTAARIGQGPLDALDSDALIQEMVLGEGCSI